MRPELRDLYQEVILDHGKRPRNLRALEGASHHAEGFNPLCGDRVDLSLIIEGGEVRDIAFQGQGCAISTASASMMTEALKGRSLEHAEALYQIFRGQITGRELTPAEEEELGKLEVFAGVREYPTRVKCAILVWHTLKAALEKQQQMVSTE